MTHHSSGAGEPNGKSLSVAASPDLPPNSVPPAESQPHRPPPSPKFEHPLMLQQSPVWSRAILWTLMIAATTAIVWACTVKIEEAIPAQGKLEPQGAVKDVQVPVNGVVKTVHVKDGQPVKKGDLLLTLDPTISQAQLDSLRQVRTTLLQENQFYQAQMSGQAPSNVTVPIPSQFLNLTKSRAALVEENQLFRAQLNGSTQGAGLSPVQRERLQSNQTELETRSTVAQLETEQLGRQFSQTEIKLASAKKTLALNQKLLDDVSILAQSGGISKVQYLKQQQEVQSNQSEVEQLVQEQSRLQFAITQAQTKVQSTVAVDRKDLTTQMAHNEQKVAEIDSQLAKAIVENNKKISETDSQITQAQQTLKYGDVRAPVDGIVFELKAATPGFVATPQEPILKIVPQDSLIAKVSITNQDIGFIKEGMTVDVRIDSFPFSEFGDVKGKLIWIGSDALPPTQIQPHYTFPVKIQLEQQAVQSNGRSLRLQSGMSLSANIKVRERTVMSIFTDQFTRTVDSAKVVR